MGLTNTTKFGRWFHQFLFTLYPFLNTKSVSIMVVGMGHELFRKRKVIARTYNTGNRSFKLHALSVRKDVKPTNWFTSLRRFFSPCCQNGLVKENWDKKKMEDCNMKYRYMQSDMNCNITMNILRVVYTHFLCIEL